MERFMAKEIKMLDTVWVMRTSDGWYPITPTEICRPEDHGRLNPHVKSIEDGRTGKLLWFRADQ